MYSVVPSPPGFDHPSTITVLYLPGRSSGVSGRCRWPVKRAVSPAHRSAPLQTLAGTMATQCDSMRLNATQCGSMRLDVSQCGSMQLNAPRPGRVDSPLFVPGGRYDQVFVARAQNTNKRLRCRREQLASDSATQMDWVAGRTAPI